MVICRSRKSKDNVQFDTRSIPDTLFRDVEIPTRRSTNRRMLIISTEWRNQCGRKWGRKELPFNISITELIINYVHVLFFKITFIRVTLASKIIWVSVCSSVIHHVFIAFRVHHPKPNVFPSPYFDSGSPALPPHTIPSGNHQTVVWLHEFLFVRLINVCFYPPCLHGLIFF